MGSIPRTGSSWILLAACLALGFALLIPQFVQADDLILAGTADVSYKRKKDSLLARTDAIEAATADAVKKALHEFVPKDLLDTKGTEIEAAILPTASALVLRREIVSEKDRDKVYSVVVRAWIDREGLKSALAAAGVSQEVGSRRTIAVVIDEYYAGDAAPSAEPMVARELEINSVQFGRTDTLDASSSSNVDAGYSADVEGRASIEGKRDTAIRVEGASGSDHAELSGSATYDDKTKAHYKSGDASNLEARSEQAYSSFAMKLKENFPPEALRQPRPNSSTAAAISARLLKRDCRLSDDASVREMRSALVGSDGVLADLVADPLKLSTKASGLRAAYGVDAVMIGTAAIIYNGEERGGHKATANLAVRIVDTSTGDIVAYAVRNNAGFAGDSQSAATAAGARLGDLLGQDLGDQLFAYWKFRDEHGVEIALQLVGVTSTRMNLRAEDILRAVPGVSGVEQRVFDRAAGVSEYVITTKESPTELKSAILRGFFADSNFANLEEELAIGSTWVFRLP